MDVLFFIDGIYYFLIDFARRSILMQPEPDMRPKETHQGDLCFFRAHSSGWDGPIMECLGRNMSVGNLSWILPWKNLKLTRF
jgi:hypothetical protein